MNGKHVVVTGATGGLGASVVELLLARGAELHLPIAERELPARLAWRGDARVHVGATGVGIGTSGRWKKDPAWGFILGSMGASVVGQVAMGVMKK